MDESKYWVRRFLTRIGELAAHPAAFGILSLYVICGFSLTLPPSTGTPCHARDLVHDVDYSSAEDRDTQALQAKLDELLRASHLADSRLAKVDTLEPEDIKRLRKDSNRLE
jgi:Low affinity iron permease